MAPWFHVQDSIECLARCWGTLIHDEAHGDAQSIWTANVEIEAQP